VKEAETKFAMKGITEYSQEAKKIVELAEKLFEGVGSF
jgi:hypothetical protein